MDCDPFAFDDFGRKGIGVAQPISGTDFPLVRPSEDVRYLLADFYLSFDDPADYNSTLTAFSPPFRLLWLHGLGCDGSSSSSVSSSAANSHVPTHDADVIVVDADDRVVFDSTLATAFAARDWGPRLRLFIWETATAVCRLVIHTKWSHADIPAPRYYPNDFEPVNATLDARTVTRAPKRLRSIRVVLDTLPTVGHNDLEITGVYNMTLNGLAPQTVGRRHVSQIEFRAIPGSGAGQYPGCEPAPLYIRTINGQPPTSDGRFFLAATDCYFARQPTLIRLGHLTIPTIIVAPYDTPAAHLPDPLAGTSKLAAGWPHDDLPQYAQLQIGNDCNACCDCDDYVLVAQDMNTIRDGYSQIGVMAETAATNYHSAWEQWNTIRTCLLAAPIRAALRPQYSPFLDVAVQLHNNGTTCLYNVTLTTTLTTAPGGGIAHTVPGYTFITSSDGTMTRYTVGGSWPTFTANWGSVPPGASVNARFRLRFANCGGIHAMSIFTPYTVTAHVTGTSLAGIINTPSATPATAIVSATMAVPTTKSNTYSTPVCTSD